MKIKIGKISKFSKNILATQYQKKSKSVLFLFSGSFWDWFKRISRDKNELTIEGLHYAVHSHTRMILPCSLVSFFYSAVWKKTTKQVTILDLLYNRISNFTQLCVLTFLSFGCSLILWYNLHKSSWIFCCVSHTKLWGGKPNMAVASAMTCEIGLIWSHVKTLFLQKLLQNRINSRFQSVNSFSKPKL